MPLLNFLHGNVKTGTIFSEVKCLNFSINYIAKQNPCVILPRMWKLRQKSKTITKTKKKQSERLFVDTTRRAVATWAAFSRDLGISCLDISITHMCVLAIMRYRCNCIPIYICIAIMWNFTKISVVHTCIASKLCETSCPATLLGLTHWSRVTHICVSELSIFGSDNGLSPGRRQAIIKTNAGLLLIWSLGTNFS